MKSPVPRAVRPAGQTPHRGGRGFEDPRHDPYAPPGKYPTPSRCERCGAVYADGRWQWTHAPERAGRVECPACRREEDALPAGTLTLQGAYAMSHRVDLVAIARNEARHESAEHPLHRIMHIDEHGERIEITTTDIHLPARIGAALKHAHGGELHIDYARGEYAVRGLWQH